MAKIKTSLTLDDDNYAYVNNQPNKSAYVNSLITADRNKNNSQVYYEQALKAMQLDPRFARLIESIVIDSKLLWEHFNFKEDVTIVGDSQERP